MCGFLAGFGKDLPAHRERLLALGGLLQHRGPDSSQLKSGGDHLFLFHRLAIQDTASRSDQPMSDVTGRYTLVFNGELYNYIELRDDLIAAGSVFHTTSDTEVLLQGLCADGKAFLERVEGMYSFVLWDREEKKILAARDPFGIKPLYYLSSPGLLLFASEPRPLRFFINDTVCPLQLAELLVFRHTPHSSSPFQKIKSLSGGHCVAGYPHAIFEEVLADPLSFLEQSVNSDPEQDSKIVSDALFRTFSLHTRSDVGYALQLSGGVDSSLTAAICSSSYGRGLECYAASFPKCAYDEGEYRARVVERYQLTHHEVSITASDFADALPETIAALDAPSPHYGCVALYLVCREAAKKHKVLLTGEGADELFGGYSRYLRLNEYAPVPQSVTTAVPTVLSDTSVVFACAYAETSAIKQLFPGLDYSFRERACIAARFPDTARQMMALDHSCYLPSLLMRQDRVAMAHGIEARVPYVDMALARALSQIPLQRRLPQERTKPLLKQFARRYLDQELVERRKNGLILPVYTWLKDERGLGRYLGALTEPSARLATYTDRRRLSAFIDRELCRGGSDTTSALMQVLNVELWLRSLDDMRSIREVV